MGQRIDQLVDKHFAEQTAAMQAVAKAVDGLSDNCEANRAFIREMARKQGE